MLIPIATLPFLSRALGPHAFGQLAVAQATAGLCAVAAEFGLSVPAMRAYAEASSRPGVGSRIVSEVTFLRLMASLFAVTCAFSLHHFGPGARVDSALLAAALILAPATAANVSWVAVAVQRPHDLLLSTVGARIAGATIVVCFVKQPDDLVLSAFASVLPQVLITLASWRWYVLHVRQPALQAPVMPSVAGWVLRALPWLLSQMAISLYASTSAVVLARHRSATDVALFSASERLSRSSAALAGPAIGALMPAVVRAAQTSTRQARTLTLAAFGAVAGFGVIALLVGRLLAPTIVHALLGDDYMRAVPLLRILLALPLAVGLGSVVTQLIMVVRRNDREVLAGYAVAAALYWASADTVAARFGGEGLAWLVVASELVSLVAFGCLLSLSWLGRARPRAIELEDGSD